jgi:hypothetical protein
MQDRQISLLTLARGEARHVLVDARTMVLVISGNVIVRGPLEWLAEAIHVPEQHLGEEQVLELATGGWVDLLAGSSAQVILLPRERQKLWRQVAHCIAYLLGKANDARTKQPVSGG